MRFLFLLVLIGGLLVGCGDDPPVFVQKSTFLPGIDDGASEIVFGPDGSSLVGGSAGSVDVLVWDVTTWEITARLTGHTSGVDDVAFSSEGLVGSATDGGFSARVWDSVTGEALQVWEFPEPVDNNLQVEFSADGSLFAVSGSDPIWVWDVSSGDLVYELSSDVFVFDIAFSPDGELLYAATDDDRVLVWDLPAGEVVHELVLPADTDPVFGLSADGSLLATKQSDLEFVLWDTGTWEQVSVLTAPAVEGRGESHSVRRPKFSPDGSMVVSAGRRGVLVWDVASGEVIHQDLLRGDSNEAVFSPDSTRIAVSEFGQGFTLWERNSSE